MMQKAKEKLTALVQRNRSLPLLLGLAVVFVAGLMWALSLSKSHLSETNASFARNNNQPIPVQTLAVEAKPVSSSLVAQASLIENQKLPIFPLAEELVEKVYVEVGSLVKQGDPLVTFKSELVKGQLELFRSLVVIAEEEYSEANNAYQKVKGMHARSLVSQDEVIKAHLSEKKAKAKLINSRYDLEKAQLQYSQITLKAPVGGIVTEVTAFAGTVARKNAPVVTLSVTNPIYVEAQVAQRYFSELQLGQPLTVVLDALPGQTFSAELVRIGYQVDRRSNTLAVYAKLANDDLALRPGMLGVASINYSSSDDNSLRVPAIALVGNNGRDAFVFKVDKDNYAHLTKVDVTGYEAGYAGIRAELMAGDQIVVAGQQNLMDGDKVENGHGNES